MKWATIYKSHSPMKLPSLLRFFISFFCLSFSLIFSFHAHAQSAWNVSPQTAPQILDFFENTDLKQCQVEGAYLAYPFDEVSISFTKNNAGNCIAVISSTAELGPTRTKKCTIDELTSVTWASTTEEYLFAPNPDCAELQENYSFKVEAYNRDEISNVIQQDELQDCEVRSLSLEYPKGLTSINFNYALSGKSTFSCEAELHSTPKSAPSITEYCTVAELQKVDLLQLADGTLRDAPINQLICKQAYKRFDYYLSSYNAAAVNKSITSGMSAVADLADIKLIYPDNSYMKFRNTNKNFEWNYLVEMRNVNNEKSFIQCAQPQFKNLNWIFSSNNNLRSSKPELNADCSVKEAQQQSNIFSWLYNFFSSLFSFFN